jgi:hypothetical protein
MKFAEELSNNRNTLVPNPNQRENLSNIINDFLERAINNVDFFPPAPDPAKHRRGLRQQAEVSPDMALQFLQACFKCGHEELAEKVIGKLLDVDSLRKSEAANWSSDVMIPLIPRLADFLATMPAIEHFSPIDKLCAGTIAMSLDWGAMSAPYSKALGYNAEYTTDLDLMALLGSALVARDPPKLVEL